MSLAYPTTAWIAASNFCLESWSEIPGFKSEYKLWMPVSSECHWHTQPPPGSPPRTSVWSPDLKYQDLKVDISCACLCPLNVMRIPNHLPDRRLKLLSGVLIWNAMSNNNSPLSVAKYLFVVYIRFIYIFLNVCPFDYTTVAGRRKIRPVNRLTTSAGWL